MIPVRNRAVLGIGSVALLLLLLGIWAATGWYSFKQDVSSNSREGELTPTAERVEEAVFSVGSRWDQEQRLSQWHRFEPGSTRLARGREWIEWEHRVHFFQVYPGEEKDLESYRKQLTAALNETGARITVQTEGGPGGNLALIQAGADVGDGEVVVTHSLLLEVPAPGGPEDKPGKQMEPAPAKIALVIDDWGYGWDAADGFLNLGRELDVPLTAAVMPNLPLTRKHAAEAKESGFEVLVHLPMEPHNDNLRLTPDTITVEMEGHKVGELMRTALEQIPEAVGVSNHMGSAATEGFRIMSAVLDILRQKELLFLDSRTSKQSIAGDVAHQLGVRYAANALFLDQVEDVEAVKERLWELAAIAKSRGQAVGIGHVKPATLAAFEEVLPRLREQNIEIVPVSDLADVPGRWRHEEIEPAVEAAPNSADTAAGKDEDRGEYMFEAEREVGRK